MSHAVLYPDSLFVNSTMASSNVPIQSHRDSGVQQSGGSVSGSGFRFEERNASQQLSSLQQAAAAAALLAQNPIAMSTQQPPGLRYGSGAQGTRSTGARRPGRSRHRATVRSPGGISSKDACVRMLRPWPICFPSLPNCRPSLIRSLTTIRSQKKRSQIRFTILSRYVRNI